jgi:hypothetical protein
MRREPSSSDADPIGVRQHLAQGDAAGVTTSDSGWASAGNWMVYCRRSPGCRSSESTVQRPKPDDRLELNVTSSQAEPPLRAWIVSRPRPGGTLFAPTTSPLQSQSNSWLAGGSFAKLSAERGTYEESTRRRPSGSSSVTTAPIRSSDTAMTRAVSRAGGWGGVGGWPSGAVGGRSPPIAESGRRAAVESATCSRADPPPQARRARPTSTALRGNGVMAPGRRVDPNRTSGVPR